uniref:Sema domain-containing protein n=1 Tax=Tetranychus urticae TaxID=32264 RepID=A0A158P4U2_TETUR
MFIHHLIWIFQFCLLIQISNSFRTFKHDIFFYYKTHDSVFLTNPTNHTTSYGIYVAGETTTINIPKNVANMSDILDWKVVDINENQLMFVHKNKPYILINRQIIREMEYAGELIDSIIAFGDNEALHVPTISNPSLTKPVHTWNYIELLYFDDENKKVSVKRSLPWLKDDWKFIKEWKMTDYIHFDDKLYLLIKRSFSKANSQSVTQEISIIRLCLDKGRELISSAVEIHFTKAEFNNDEIIDLIFVYIFGSSVDGNNRYQLHTILKQSQSSVNVYHTYSLSDIVSLFEETANECASGSVNINPLQHHLRSEIGKCKKTSHESCSTKENIVPSRNFVLNTTFLETRATAVQKFQYISLPYPYFRGSLLLHVKPNFYTSFCEYITSAPSTCKNFIANSDYFAQFAQADFHINKYPNGFVYVTKETNQILFIPIEVCPNLKTCTQCIMYGLYFDCIWSNSNCVPDTQPKNKAALTVDHCFKVINISPKIFNSSFPTILTIGLDKSLNFTASQEQLLIRAGDNNCTDITMNGLFIICSMNLTKSGRFKIDVSLRNDRYADAAILSSVSTEKVKILAPENDYYYTFVLILIIMTVSLISIFLVLGYSIHNAKHQNEFIEVASSANIMRMATKSIKSSLFSLSSSRSRSTWRTTSKTIVPKHFKWNR